MGLGLIEMILLGLVATLLLGGLVAGLSIALVASKSAPATAARPDAAPCPKCKALIPLGKRSCGACGAQLA